MSRWVSAVKDGITNQLASVKHVAGPCTKPPTACSEVTL